MPSATPHAGQNLGGQSLVGQRLVGFVLVAASLGFTSLLVIVNVIWGLFR